MKTQDITIDKEFENLIRPLAKKEREELRVSLSRCGLLSPLIVWKTGGKTILVDGHNRLSLWKEYKGFNEEYELKTHELPFSSKGVAKEWIIKNQLGRRNLSPEDFKLLVGQLYNQRKTTQGGDKKSKAQTEPLINIAEKIAAETGVSRETVKRAGKLAEKVEEIQAAQPEAPRAEVVAKAKGAVMKDNLTKPKKKKAEVKLPAGCAEVGTSFKSMISEASDDMFQWMLDCISAEKKNRKARSNT